MQQRSSGAAEQRSRGGSRAQRVHLELAQVPRDLAPHIATGARRRRGEVGVAATSAGSAIAVDRSYVTCWMRRGCPCCRLPGLGEAASLVVGGTGGERGGCRAPGVGVRAWGLNCGLVASLRVCPAQVQPTVCLCLTLRRERENACEKKTVASRRSFSPRNSFPRRVRFASKAERSPG